MPSATCPRLVRPDSPPNPARGSLPLQTVAGSSRRSTPVAARAATTSVFDRDFGQHGADRYVEGSGRRPSVPGWAHVFTQPSGIWTQQQKLTADDGAMFGLFGKNVALDSCAAIVGADDATVAQDGATALVGARGATINDNDGQGSRSLASPIVPCSVGREKNHRATRRSFPSSAQRGKVPEGRKGAGAAGAQGTRE